MSNLGFQFSIQANVKSLHLEWGDRKLVKCFEDRTALPSSSGDSLSRFQYEQKVHVGQSSFCKSCIAGAHPKAGPCKAHRQAATSSVKPCHSPARGQARAQASCICPSACKDEALSGGGGDCLLHLPGVAPRNHTATLWAQ